MTSDYLLLTHQLCFPCYECWIQDMPKGVDHGMCGARSYKQGSCESLNFFPIFKAWKVLENRHGPWKSLNLCLKVLESAWVDFLKRRALLLVEGFWGPDICLECVVGRGSVPDPTGGAHDAPPGPLVGSGGGHPHSKNPTAVGALIPAPSLIYPSYGPWKLILTNGQEPCIKWESGGDGQGTEPLDIGKLESFLFYFHTKDGPKFSDLNDGSPPCPRQISSHGHDQSVFSVNWREVASLLLHPRLDPPGLVTLLRCC